MSFFILNKNDGPWIFSAMILTILAKIFHSANGKYDGGVYYIAFVMLFMVLVFLLHIRFEFDDKGFSLFGFMIGVFILLFGEPLFENDHYRYLFEGKVFFKGLNPYKHPPVHDIYKSVAYFAKEKISFNYLTTVYPPLALIWFGFAALFGFKVGMIVLTLLNSIMVFYLYRLFLPRVKPILLFLLIPFFQKEYIQGVHLDLFAAMGLLLFFLGRNSKEKLLGIFISYWGKILGLAMIPFYLLTNKVTAKKVILTILLVLSLPITLYLLVGDFSYLNGAKAFGRHWVWNSGFYGILADGLNFTERYAREISIKTYFLYLFIIGGFLIFLSIKQKFRLKESQVLISLYLIFSGLMFFTPVYNAWYAIWFLIPGLLLGNVSSVMYTIFSCWGYIYYGHSDLHEVGEIFTHLWFPLSLIELYWRGNYPEQLASPKTQNLAQNS